MTNNVNVPVPTRSLVTASRLITGYLGLTVATVVALGVLSAVAPPLAPQEAWVHAVIVLVFAVLLRLRARSAVRGNHRGLTAVRIISAVLVLANVVEAVLPHAFPGWMRVMMVLSALLMIAVSLLAARRPAVAR